MKWRKLANSYQLRVLMIHRGKQLLSHPEAAAVGFGEALFAAGGASGMGNGGGGGSKPAFAALFGQGK